MNTLHYLRYSRINTIVIVLHQKITLSAIEIENFTGKIRHNIFVWVKLAPMYSYQKDVFKQGLSLLT